MNSNCASLLYDGLLYSTLYCKPNTTESFVMLCLVVLFLELIAPGPDV